MSTTEETRNKATFERFHDATNSRDVQLVANVIDELVAPDAVIHAPLPIDATGARYLQEVFATLLRGYPDLHITAEDVIAAGDKIVSRNSVTGTHLGEYLGMQPTGTCVTYNEIFIFRFAGGRIVEVWGVVDVFAQMKQLGAIAA